MALLGTNGSGKTTLLRLAAGLLQPDAGEVLVFGTPAVAGRREVGIAFQDSRLLSWRSASRNVALPLEVEHGLTAAVRSAASAALSRVNGLALADRAPDQLSGGERQRVALARALIRQPALLLLDEPFAALDAPTRSQLSEELPDLIRGAATLLVTHDVTEALTVADRVLLLNEGGNISATWHGLRDLAPGERRAVLTSAAGILQRTELLAALDGVARA